MPFNTTKTLQYKSTHNTKEAQSNQNLRSALKTETRSMFAPYGAASRALILALFGAMSIGAAAAEDAAENPIYTPTKADESLLDQGRIHTVGNNGGKAVNIPASLQQAGVISDIRVCGGNWLDSITVTYGNEPAPMIGNIGGDCGYVEGLGSPSAKITAVNIWAGNWIDGIQFQVDGKWGRIFGTQGAKLYPYRAATDGGLAFIEGRAGAKIDQLTLSFGLPYKITDVVYNKRSIGDQVNTSEVPQFAGRTCFVNDTRSEQTATKTWDIIETETKNWNFGTSTEWNVSVEYGFGVEGLGEGSISAGVGQTTTDTKGGSQSRQVKLGDSMTQAVQPGEKVEMVYEYKRKAISIPTSFRITHYKDSPNNVVKVTPPLDQPAFTTVQTGTEWGDGSIVQRTVSECGDGIIELLGRPDEQRDSAEQNSHSNMPTTPNFSWAAIPNGGGFKWAGDGTWYELSPSGERAFTFEVLSQTDSEIKLRDVNRNILIVLDFANDKVRYAPNPQGTPRDLYVIVNKS